MAHPFSLAGRTALVTGSSRGIGKAIAMALGRAGAKVVFHGASDSPALRAALAEADAAGIARDVRFADIGSAAACDELAASCADADILVLNASAQSDRKSVV